VNKKELIALLKDMAELDLTDGSVISDHPCSVAAKAIEQCIDDINFLRDIVNGKVEGKSKAAITMLKMPYNPRW